MLCDFYNDSLEYQENLLTKYYLKHGHDVTIITSTFESVFDFYADRYNKNMPQKVYVHEGVKIIRLRYRYNILNRLRAYTSIYRVLEQEKPDLIYVHDIMLNILEVIKYKKKHTNCKIILDYHADYSNSAKNYLSLKVLHGVIRKWFLDKARKHISKIFPIVPASATFLHEVYKVPYLEMELLPLGADTDLGTQVRNSDEGKKLRHLYNIPNEDIVIFTGGKLSPEKKTDLLIEAFNVLGQMNLHLFVIGSSPDPDSNYHTNLMKLANHSNIHFTGWLNNYELTSYLDMADLAVFPASQSVLWQKAICMGLPLVVGDVGHQDATYLNLYNNIIILKNNQIDIENIAAAVRNLVENTQLRMDMGEGARKVTSELLDWNVLINKTLNCTVAS